MDANSTDSSCEIEMVKKSVPLARLRSSHRLEKLAQTKSANKEYAVERILNHQYRLHETSAEQILYFLVKWEGFDESHATWEKARNTRNCPKLVENYWKSARKRREQRITATGDLKKSKLSDEAREWFQRQFANRFTGGCQVISAEESVIHSGEIQLHLSVNSRQLQAAIVDGVHRWQLDMDSKLAGAAALTVENNVDYQLAPKGFEFVTENVFDSKLHTVNEESSACQCNSGKDCDSHFRRGNFSDTASEDLDFCCPHIFGQERFPYDSEGRLLLKYNDAIYECNANCGCASKWRDFCPNRVVQKGRKIPLAIYRTTLTGWGVKTLDSFKAGTFVTTMVGEVITAKEARRRSKFYRCATAGYIVDLIFHAGPAEFAVDCTRFGNESRFINHSCQPNLVGRLVWTESQQANLPTLALFAQRDVSAGEQLTVDYNFNTSHDRKQGLDFAGAAQLEDEGKVVLYCHCGADNCREVLWVEGQETEESTEDGQ